MIEFIRYEDVYSILHEKYNVSHDELLYWIQRDTALQLNRSPFSTQEEILLDMGKTTSLCCFVSDIESNVKYLHGYKRANEHFNYPYGFYVKLLVDNFIPNPELRLVSIQSIHNRFWKQWDRLEDRRYSPFPSLDKAAENGMLHFYDEREKRYTLYSSYIGDHERAQPILWYHTDIGIKKLSDPNTLFQLFDIIQIERVFEGRSREECMKELKRIDEDKNDQDHKTKT